MLFEKWAVTFANQIKKSNPEETEPTDVLVFGFTIVFNLLFTFLVLLVLGAVLGVLALTLQVFLSFMLLRLLTGGAHLENSLFCSIATIALVSAFVWLPVSINLISIYFVITIILLLLYAPYYEGHQVQHSPQWERKKKWAALLWVGISLVIYLYYGQPGFILGALIQALLLTTPCITFTYKLNNLLKSGR